VVDRGEVVHSRGYGIANLEYGIPITPTSPFHVASVSKQFSAFAVALLAADGMIELDANVLTYLPELPDYGAAIRVRHLIHHVSGLPDQWDLLTYAGWREDDVKTTGDILELVARQRKLNFPPGTEYLYSNTGYTLLALIVERVAGMSLRDFTSQEIFRPLGMDHTYFRDDHSEIVPHRTYAYVPRQGGGPRVSVPVFDTVGATSLMTTAEDLILWGNAMMSRTFRGAAIWEQVLTPGKLEDGSPLEYAFGLMVREYGGLETIEHSGVDAGYRAFFLRFPSRDLTVVLLSNVSTIEPRGMAFRVADLYLDPAARSRRIEDGHSSERREYAVMVEDDELEQRTGLFRDPSTGTYRKVVREGHGLKLANLLGIDLSKRSPDHYVGVLATVDLQFAVAQDGTRLLLERAPGHQRQFVKTREMVLAVDKLTEYEGAFSSEELGTTITIVLDGTDLTMRRRKFPSKRLAPVAPDVFAVDDAVDVSFVRDAEGEIVGLLLATERSRHMSFKK
jgi:CubicO group peptidase (beta-lactamase class C family)